MKAEEIINDHIQKIVKKQEEFILSVFKKQTDFISIEESKDFIEVKQMYNESKYLGTDYVFKGKVILTVYPSEMKEEDGQFKSYFNYIEY